MKIDKKRFMSIHYKTQNCFLHYHSASVGWASDFVVETILTITRARSRVGWEL